MEAILGYIMIFVIVFLLMKKIMNPIAVFAIIPPIFGLLAGYSISDLSGFISAGISSTLTNALVALFAVTYFSIMTDQGLFYPIAQWVTKKCGTRPLVVIAMTYLLANITHADTQSTSTILVTVPTLLPIFTALGIDPKLLYIAIGMAMGNMNQLPMGGSMIMAANSGGSNAAELFKMDFPLMVAGLISGFVIFMICGQMSLKKGKYVAKGTVSGSSDVGLTWDTDMSNFKLDGKYAFNALFTLFLFAMMFLDLLPPHYIFMLGCAIAIVVNYGTSASAVNSAYKKYVPNGIMVALTMFSAGIFIGVLAKSTMIGAMTDVLINFIPESMAGFLGVFYSLFTIITGPFIDDKGYLASVMPLFMDVATKVGYSATAILAVSVPILDPLQLLRPANARVYQISGMINEDYLDCMKAALLPLLLVALSKLVAAIVLGIVPLSIG